MPNKFTVNEFLPVAAPKSRANDPRALREDIDNLYQAVEDFQTTNCVNWLKDGRFICTSGVTLASGVAWTVSDPTHVLYATRDVDLTAAGNTCAISNSGDYITQDVALRKKVRYTITFYTKSSASTSNNDRPRASNVPSSERASTSSTSALPLVMNRFTPYSRHVPAASS